jgi:3-oxoacyl-[acyl-carrier-protein] synthase II
VSDAVVTGIGLITSLGHDREQTWQAIKEERRGLGPLTLFPLEGRTTPVVAEVASPPGLTGLPRRATAQASRTDRLALACALEAVRDAGLTPKDFAQAAVVFGASSSGMLEGETYYHTALERGHAHARRGLLAGLEAASTTARVACALGAMGPRSTFTTACSSSAHAVGHALDLVRSGAVDVAVAGGSDGLCRLVVAGFLALENVSPRGCRPFARDRDGMTLGEGAAVLVIEDGRRARERGRKGYARLLGYGSSCEAHHATATEPSGRGAAQALRAALGDAGLGPGSVGYVNAHGTGTRDNDPAEALAIAAVFPHGPPVSSTKALHGHTLGAAGALEAAIVCLALREGFLPGQGESDVDPALAIDVALRGREARLEAAVSLSLAFGGNDAALVLGAIR